MIYFISDLHLGAKYIADKKAHEMRVVHFLESIASDCTHLFMLGDILDYWYEYRTVVPRGYVRFFGALARLSDAGVKITWMTGNHDIWLFDYLRDELGIEVVDSPYIERCIEGRKFVLAHGDRIGRRKASFKFICRLFRNKFCQKLYSSIHPRWTIPFAHSWSNSSRDNGGFNAPEGDHIAQVVSDVKPLENLNPDFIVIGHHHLVIDRVLSCGARLIGLGDWISENSYGKFDGRQFELLHFPNS